MNNANFLAATHTVGGQKIGNIKQPDGECTMFDGFIVTKRGKRIRAFWYGSPSIAGEFSCGYYVDGTGRKGRSVSGNANFNLKPVN
jgi:hypothetical protein